MRVVKPLILFLIGGLAYILMELLFRWHTHWTMFIVGGLCFLLLGAINEYTEWDVPLLIQSLIGGAIITEIEFFAGCIINLWLGWNVWDYSSLPFNVLGQICLPFSVIWIFLATIGIILDDYLRYWLFGEEKPHYTIM